MHHVRQGLIEIQIVRSLFRTTCEYITMTTLDKLLPAQRARPSREPKPVVYGFPLATAAIYNCFDKISPLPSDTNEEDRQRLAVNQIIDLCNYLQSQCMDIWPRNKIQFSSAYVNKKRRLVLHFGKCLRRDGSLIPNGDELEQLKEILAKDGFKEEPGWFVFIQ